jgi:hypothetical protein
MVVYDFRSVQLGVLRIDQEPPSSTVIEMNSTGETQFFLFTTIIIIIIIYLWLCCIAPQCITYIYIVLCL